MNWFNNLTSPGIKRIFRKKDDNDDSLWLKCKSCSSMIFHRDYEEKHYCCPSCGHHGRITPLQRFKLLFDNSQYDSVPLDPVVIDPLKFKDIKKYTDRLSDARKKTKEQDAISIAKGKVKNLPIVALAQNFFFMGGSMGLAVGQAIIKSVDIAIKENAPLVIFTSSGGARMQEGLLSLMQMPRSIMAISKLKSKRIPYIVVLTDPTSGGVTASFAMIGDIHLAEPGAMIAFSGPRVIKQTIGEDLPEGFQCSEYLYDRGIIDQVVNRADLPEKLASILTLLHYKDNKIIKGVKLLDKETVKTAKESTES